MKLLRGLEIVKEDQERRRCLDLFKGQESNFVKKTHKLGQISEMWRNLGEVSWCWLFDGGMVS